MKIIREDIEGISFIKLTNEEGLEVTFSNLGASIYSVIFNHDYLTLTPLNVKDFKLGNLYHGKTIGRVANRIKDGVLEVNNRTYFLDKNEGHNTLHGGKEGLSNQIFDYEIKEEKDYTKISFHYLSKKEESLFPGNFSLEVTYTLLNKENTLRIDYEAMCDEDSPVNVTNHSFFNLSSPNINDLSLYINASRFIHPREIDLVPLEIRSVTDALDFRKQKLINRDINDPYLIHSRSNGYDHHFIFDEMNINKPQVILENDKYKLEILTSFSGTQIYSDNYEKPYLFSSTSDNTHRAIAIEPQDSTLNREVYKANSKYKRFIKYKFIKK